MRFSTFGLAAIVCVIWATGGAGDLKDGSAKLVPSSASNHFDRAAVVNSGVPSIIKTRRIAGVGIAVIRNYRVVWTNYFGEQGPGVPVTRKTMFNTASVAKSITTETVLRLASQGRISLDETIADYYIDPDLANDPRYRLLTPRLILTHRSGLPNWPSGNNKLAFIVDPGTRMGYSGSGFQILANYLERKFHTEFDTLVGTTVFAPLGMTGASMRRRSSIDARVTTPMNSDGLFGVPYTTRQPDPRHNGSWSAAGDFFVTIDDYAKFVISVMKEEGVTSALAKERWQVRGSFENAGPDWECHPEPSVVCPDPYGFGLGWLVFDYGDSTFAWAGGNDSGENALAYFYPTAPGDAVIVFINGGNGVLAMPDIVDLIDPHQKWSAYIRQIIDRHFHPKEKQ